jgi:carbonic anhydrase
MISAIDALERLRAGNRRFVSGKSTIDDTLSAARRAELVDGQSPFAVILACSDSRVPVELVFCQGLGDLFVIRVAGNVVAPSQIGSVEYAAARLGTKLVVVLGHSNCGAVDATLQELAQVQETRSPNLRSIVDRIRPAVEPLLKAKGRHGSAILEERIASGDIVVVGAEYSIESGEVIFFDD